MSRNSYKVSVVCCYVTCRSNLTKSRIGYVNEHTLPRVAKKNVTSGILLVLITKTVINYTYYVNLYFAYKIQILVKTDI